MNRTTCLKILVAILFGCTRIFFGLLPLKVYKWLCTWQKDRNDKNIINKERHEKIQCALAMCQSFGGGVLFATCILHMIPQVFTSMQHLKLFDYLKTDYPLHQLTVSIGFFVVYFMEEWTDWFVKNVPERCAKDLPNNKVTPIDGQVISDNRNEGCCCSKVEIVNYQQKIRGILMVLALSLHTIFEGLSIGLQTEMESIWFLFIAVTVHSGTILFCIGLEMVISETKTKNIVLHILALSLTSPLGVIVGIVITIKTPVVKSFAGAILEGFSTGVILYITFFEVLNREKARRTFRFKRSLCILGGFVLMAILQCIEIQE